MRGLQEEVSRQEFRQGLLAGMQQKTMAGQSTQILRSKRRKNPCASAQVSTSQYQGMPNLRERFYFEEKLQDLFARASQGA
jgi:hypothetical protein